MYNDENHKTEVNVLFEKIVACLHDDLCPCTDNVSIGYWDVISDGTRACQNLRNYL